MTESAWEWIEIADKVYERGDYRQAIGMYESAIAQAYRNGEPRAELAALNSLCGCYLSIPDWENCVRSSTRLLARSRSLDAPDFVMRATFHLALAIARIDLAGRWQEIQPLLLEGADRARQLGLVSWQARHLILLAGCEIQLGKGDVAYALLQDALNVTLSVSDNEVERSLKASIYAMLAILHATRDDFRDAKYYMELAGGITRALKDIHGMFDLELLETCIDVMSDEQYDVPPVIEQMLTEAGSLGWKGTQFLAIYLNAFRVAEAGNVEEALNLLGKALALAQEMKSREWEAACLAWLAYEYVNLDDMPRTLFYLAELQKVVTQDFIPGIDFGHHCEGYIQARLALMYSERGELSEALSMAESAIATYHHIQDQPGIVDTTATQVRLLIDLGLGEKAQTVIQDILTSGLQAEGGYFRIGIYAQRFLHDWHAAEAAYRLCLKWNSKHSMAWNNLAYVLYERDEPAEAVECWQKSLELHAGSSDALAGLALGLWSLGKHEGALAALNQALAQESKYADPTWLAQEPFWSIKAINAAQPMLQAAKTTYNVRNSGVSQ